MNKVYVPYFEWEDWLNGMWRNLPKEEESKMLKKAIKFTGDYLKYGKAMMNIVKLWPNTMLNTLTNKSANRRAFVGHCACCGEFNCPEYITRMAWKELTNMQRELADKEAQKAIDYWTIKLMEDAKKNRGIRKDMGRQMLLRWDS